MRVLVPVLILFVVSLSWAQAPGIGDVRPLNTAITQACLDDFVVNSKDRKHTQGLPGTYFKSLLPQPGETCNEESSQKKVHYELLLVAESHEGPQPKISDPAEERYTMQYAVQNLLPAFDPKAPLTNWNPDDVRKFAQDSLDKWNQETKKGMFFVLPATLDPSLSVDRNFLVEGLVRAMASANLTETELTKQVGKFIRDTYATEEERFTFINVLSSRLYVNYNNTRNPFNNNCL